MDSRKIVTQAIVLKAVAWLAASLLVLLFGPTVAPVALSATPIRLGFSAWPGWIPWQVTQDAKLFEANKVSVDLKWFDGYLDSINALAAGQLEANCQTLNDTLSSVAAGADQVVVLANDNSTGNDQIIVSEGIATIADLKGKSIAVEQGTVDHFMLLLALQKEGMTQADIELKPLETGAAASAFAAGQVDAAAVFAPFTTQALKRPGSKVLLTSKDFPGAIPDLLVVNRKLIETQPEQVQGLVDSWFATLDYIAANPEETLTIMAKRAGVSESEYQEYEAGTTIFNLEQNLKTFSPGEDMTHLPYAAEQISKFLSETGLSQGSPDLSQLFDDQFIKAHAAKMKG
jgi:NitT/TauT family transport system substrate-binding protein